MKNLTLLLSILISVHTLFAGDTLKVSSKIKDVTVFFSGAQISRSVDLKASKGKHVLVLNQLPNTLNDQSIQVKSTANCKILAVKHELVYPDTKKSNQQKILEDKIEIIEQEMKRISNKYKVFMLEEALLLENSKLNGYQGGSAISEIKEAANYYRQRLNEIRQLKLNLTIENKEKKDAIQELNAKINVITVKKRSTYCKIIISIDCIEAINDDLRISYYISSAAWTPNYDFRVDEITEPLSIVYKAEVYQSSGENWDKVNLKLSTNNPSLSGEKPELVNWVLGKPDPYQKANSYLGSGTLKGRILDVENGDPLSLASIIVFSDNQIIRETITDTEGNYMIKPIPEGYYKVKISSVGYLIHSEPRVKINDREITFFDHVMGADVDALPERSAAAVASITGGVQTSEGSGDISIRGSRSDNAYYYIDGIKVRGSSNLPKSALQEVHAITGGVPANYGDVTGGTLNMFDRGSFQTNQWTNENRSLGKRQKSNIESEAYISNSLKSSVANLEYKIDEPYTIPSDGKDYSIKIKEIKLPVDYTYYSVPKLDEDAFLTAELPNWTALNLLPGKSNIYYQGTYIGESNIETQSTSDTLSISLGRDQNIFLKREGNKELFDKRVTGNYIKETIAWDITIRNNKNVKIKIIIEDQFPISNRKSIEIERLDYSGAKLNEKTGKLSWEIVLNANEKKDLKFNYLVKYPKNSNINL